MGFLCFTFVAPKIVEVSVCMYVCVMLLWALRVGRGRYWLSFVVEKFECQSHDVLLVSLRLGVGSLYSARKWGPRQQEEFFSP